MQETNSCRDRVKLGSAAKAQTEEDGGSKKRKNKQAQITS
jgi:hypothetical protein